MNYPPNLFLLTENFSNNFIQQEVKKLVFLSHTSINFVNYINWSVLCSFRNLAERDARG